MLQYAPQPVIAMHGNSIRHGCTYWHDSMAVPLRKLKVTVASMHLAHTQQVVSLVQAEHTLMLVISP